MRTSRGFVDMTTVVPEGRAGNAVIDHIDVTKMEATLGALHGSMTLPGRYCRLCVEDETMMSDTQDEQRSNAFIVQDARGDVLITGLGIGMITIPICRKENVASVTIIEKNPGVIELVEPAIRRYLGKDAGKLAVLQDDAFTYRPSRHYDVIYHDIWPTIDVENLPEITRLKRRYGCRKRPDGVHRAWQESRLRDLKRRAAFLY